MKKTTFIFVLFLFTTSFIFSQQATCGFTEYEKRLQQKYPNRKTDAQFEAWLQSKIENSKNKREINQLTTIPVVVHVIHNGDPVGTGKNIGDTQILSQITALNYDMRRTQGTLGYNTNPVGADVEIEFALAKVDPNGNPTNGIDRIKFCNTEIWDPDTIDGILKPQSIWDPSKYLNIWVVNSISPTLGLIGYATFPQGSGLNGITTGIVGTNITDGIIVDYTAFGSNIYTDGSFFLAMPYNTGRILTHEIGHWMGLRHIWGDADCGEDYCADTPIHQAINLGCPSNLSCDNFTPQMPENYMDYTDDTCKNIFTIDQKIRMTTVMDNAVRRVSLKTSTNHLPIPLFENDGEIKIERTCSQAVSNCQVNFQPSIQTVTLNNRGTNTITSATLSYSLNGDLPTQYFWFGNLEPNKSSTFDVPIVTNTSGTNTINITSINGFADARNTNNTAIGQYVMPLPLVNYNFTSVKFQIQNSSSPLFQAWTLKNSNGQTVQSGNYNGNFGVTQFWNLPPGECYTFNVTGVNDSGNHFYKISSFDGNTVIHNVTQFVSNDPKYFNINLPLLNGEEFETLETLKIYPNPVENELSISNEGMDNIELIEIYNNLGQKIISKNTVIETNLKVNTSNIAKGIYFLKVNTALKTKTFRFIKK